MTRFRRTMLTASSALALAALLTGCSVASGNLAGLIPSGGPAPASATPTPTAIPGDTDGNGKLSEFEKQILATNAARDYTMPDGSVVKIDPTQPLPAAVAEAVKSEAAPIAAALGALGAGRGTQKAAQLVNLMSESDSIQNATGKAVIFVYPTLGSTPAGEEWVWATTASHTDSTGIAAVQSKDTVLSDAQFWASTRGYEVIVFE